MKRKFLLAASASLLAATAAQPALADHHGETMTTTANAIEAAPLIPRENLYGNPTRASGEISPDGQWLAWLAPSNGVLNVWLAPASDPDSAKVMTQATDRPIRQFFFAPDSRSLLYIQDKGGDENFLLYGVDLATGTERTLTDFENTRVQLIGASVQQKDKLLVGLNNRDARFHDVHLLDLNTGDLSLVMQNDAYAGFLADDNLDLKIALRPNAEGGMDFFRIDDGEVAGEPFGRTTLEDALTTNPAGFTTDGNTLYFLDSRGRNTAALTATDMTTGETRVIAEDERALHLGLADALRELRPERVERLEAVAQAVEHGVAGLRLRLSSKRDSEERSKRENGKEAGKNAVFHR